MIESWKTYPEFDYIEVSDMGNVRTKDRRIMGRSLKMRSRKGRILKQTRNERGYPEIRIQVGGLNSPRVVHKMVMLTFVGERPKGMQINHINGRKDDNRLINLEWSTPSDNMKHAYETGLLSRKGENNTKAKLTETFIKEIREKYKSGKYTQKQLGKEYNVAQAHISTIVKGKTWNYDLP
jgi:hypothetical protein